MTLFKSKLIVLSVFAVAVSMALAGCSHGDDSTPTNTKNSTYVSSGQTAADKIGQDRENAHRARLPGNGAGGN